MLEAEDVGEVPLACVGPPQVSQAVHTKFPQPTRRCVAGQIPGGLHYIKPVNPPHVGMQQARPPSRDDFPILFLTFFVHRKKSRTPRERQRLACSRDRAYLQPWPAARMFGDPMISSDVVCTGDRGRPPAAT